MGIVFITLLFLLVFAVVAVVYDWKTLKQNKEECEKFLSEINETFNKTKRRQ